MENIGILDFRDKTESFLIEDCLVFVDLVFANEIKFKEFFEELPLSFGSHFFFELEAVCKVSGALLGGEDQGKGFIPTSFDLFGKFDAIGETEFGKGAEVFFLDLRIQMSFMDLSNFGFISVLKFVMTVVEINGFHEKVEGSNGLLNRVEL